MKEVDNQNEIAGSTEQKVPDRMTPRPADPAAMFLVELPRPVHSANYPPSAPDWSRAADARTLHRARALNVSGTPAVAGTLERLHALILDEIKVIRLLGPESLVAVLEPDANTELLFRLRPQAGGWEASAQFERGDRARLQDGWADLQRRLARQGVRLSALK